MTETAELNTFKDNYNRLRSRLARACDAAELLAIASSELEHTVDVYDSELDVFAHRMRQIELMLNEAIRAARDGANFAKNNGWWDQHQSWDQVSEKAGRIVSGLEEGD